MSEAESIRHFLKELTKMERTMDGSEERQTVFIRLLRQYIQGEVPGSKRIRELPYPAALYTRSGFLVSASWELVQSAGISLPELSAGHINLLNRITTENSGVLDAAVGVFAGETGVVNDLVAPISMFVQNDDLPEYQGGYQTALFFPVRPERDAIAFGAVVLLKQKVVIQFQEE